MFAKLAIYTTAVFSVLAVATPVARDTGSCSTGSIQCCDSVSKASDPTTSVLLGLLGVVVQGVDVLVGLTCSPISVVGVGSSSCSSNVVCCENNNVGGLISVGCLPIIL
ncbi:fungal hydrophobin [Lentinus brumalis]|uniref:Hydrophobin n=1 Tax=Lentinus brumalis TaxID=2498619 RepID=A0A371DGK2_9APHY|nr:fungal hydrophobin [Polyporus brumalis]